MRERSSSSLRFCVISLFSWLVYQASPFAVTRASQVALRRAPVTEAGVVIAATAQKDEDSTGSSYGVVGSLALLGGLAFLGARRRTAARAHADADMDLTEILERAPADLTAQRQAYAALPESEKLPPPRNDLVLRVARGEKTDAVPKWLMRQAGRYLPEFRAIRAMNRFFEVCQSPALAAEVTLQPLRRYSSLDCGIIFSDILVIPQAMGQEVQMVPGKGPVAPKPIRTPKDLEGINMKPDIEKTLGYVFDAIYLTIRELGNRVPIIGFCGAPWTLMAYMIEGGGTRTWEHAKTWLHQYPNESRRWMRAIADICVEYLIGQYDAGAPILQVFDSNAGDVPPGLYEEFMVQDLKYIATEIKKRRPKALLSVFPRGANLASFNNSDYDIVGVAWNMDPKEARKQCPDKVLQGNLDPCTLFAEPAEIRRRTQEMVSQFGPEKYIANLGHGMMPNHTPEGVQAFVEAIDDFL